ncbi:hypothetical protein B0H13DRAFT_2054107 [Mycena leptocephala]|nr:hypothetical protein B0H13DRAFT_2054107 [Mycena leptocephala]
MYVSFRPDPPVPPFGTEWMVIGRTLPYGPFNRFQSFECDPVIWQLWVEFHQKIRPIVTQSDIWRHMADAEYRLGSFTKFRDCLVDHLGHSGVLAFPNPAVEGPMHQRKFWVCIVHDVQILWFGFYSQGFRHRLKLEDLYLCVGFNCIRECFSRDPSSFSYSAGQWPTPTSEPDPPAILITDYEPRRLNSRIIRRNIHRQSLDVDM